MEIITIALEEKDGKPMVHLLNSSNVTPEAGAAACRFAARQFDEAVIEAEIERRMQERTAGNEAD